jgi:hypothetical protein
MCTTLYLQCPSTGRPIPIVLFVTSFILSRYSCIHPFPLSNLHPNKMLAILRQLSSTFPSKMSFFRWQRFLVLLRFEFGRCSVKHARCSLPATACSGLYLLKFVWRDISSRLSYCLWSPSPYAAGYCRISALNSLTSCLHSPQLEDALAKLFLLIIGDRLAVLSIQNKTMWK